MDRYKLANIMFQWDGGGLELARGKYMEAFRYDNTKVEDMILFQGCFVSLETYTRFPLLIENSVYALFDVNGERLLIYHWGNRRFAFAIWPERIQTEQVNECWFDPDMCNQPRLNADWFFGVSGLHKALLHYKAGILHASYVDCNGQAILFTAPSGTGKSTQAVLWETYKGAEIVNGDRVLLRKWKEQWHAFGYPCCGSSKICLNRTLPLRAVVVLRQSLENHIEKLPESQKIRAISLALEVYPWDSSEINSALNLAESLVQDVAVVCLACRPDADAVHVLNQYLEVEDHANGI